MEQVFTFPPPIPSDTIVTTCYIIPSYKRNNAILSNSDNFNNGNYFEQLIFELPYDYSSQFLITVHQNSITRGAYNYWQLVKQESRRSGSIFDPAPVNIKGNIEPTKITQKPALGYFMASASKSRRLLIDRSIAKGTPDKARLEGDCRYLYHRAYEEKPEGFR